MRSLRTIVCAVALLAPASPIASACPPPSHRWSTAELLPPSPTVYLLPVLPAVMDPDPVTCVPGEPWERPRWPLLPGQQTPLDPQQPDAVYQSPYVLPAQQAWAFPVPVDELATMSDGAGQPVSATGELRLVGSHLVYAFTVARPAGPLVLGAMVDRHLPDADPFGESWHPRLREVSAAARPAWTAVAVVPAPRSELLVERGCVELELRGEGVGYWTIETPRCLDQLVAPPGARWPRLDAAVTDVRVPRACLGGEGALTLVEHGFDGKAVRYPVAAPLAAPGQPRPAWLAIAFGVAAAALRRRRPWVAVVP